MERQVDQRPVQDAVGEEAEAAADREPAQRHHGPHERAGRHERRAGDAGPERDDLDRRRHRQRQRGGRPLDDLVDQHGAP
jgi:hypothetical protein